MAQLLVLLANPNVTIENFRLRKANITLRNGNDVKSFIDSFMFPGPFVKVSLILTGRQIKKTKTSVVKNTLLPVYNEAFVFDVPVHRLSDVSLLLRVLNSQSTSSSNGSSEETQETRTIGKAIVGPDAKTSIGLHHWNCMMTTPRKPIAQWHPLIKT